MRRDDWTRDRDRIRIPLGQPASHTGGEMVKPSRDSGQAPNLLSGHFHKSGRSQVWALAFLLPGALFVALGMLVAVGVPRRVGGIPGVVAGFLAGLALSYFGARLLLRAKRYRAPTAQQVLARDPRQPVLYFRPFADDPTAGKGVTFTSWFTEEEQLAKVVSDIGPFVAIGAPGEFAPEVGAARFYVPDAEWHQAVQHLLARARLVVLRIGRSSGFWWELETALRGRKPEGLLLLIPRDEQLYEEFRRRSRELIPCDLPRLTGWNYRKPWRGSLKAAVFFDPDWVPNIVDVQTYSLPLVCRSPAHPLVPILKMALRPVFEHLSVPFKPPGTSWRLIVLLVAVPVWVALSVNQGLDRRTNWSQQRAPASYELSAGPSAVVKAKNRFAGRLTAIPEVRSRIEAVINSPELKALPREEARARASATVQEFARIHARAGMRRLSAAQLLTKLALDRKMLAAAELDACAAYSRGNASSAQIDALLGHLDAAELVQWFELVAQAVAADLKGAPARSADLSRRAPSLAPILDRLPKDDSRRLRRILANLRQGLRRRSLLV